MRDTSVPFAAGHQPQTSRITNGNTVRIAYPVFTMRTKWVLNVLEPISIWVKPNGQWEIIQRCRACGEMKNSPMSEDDSPIKILAVASRPLSSPPFPVERMEELTKIMGGRGDVGGYYLEQRKQEAKI